MKIIQIFVVLVFISLVTLGCGNIAEEAGNVLDQGSDSNTQEAPVSESSAESGRLDGVETTLLNLINEERQTKSLPALVRDSDLDKIMLWKASEMVNTRILEHSDVNGRGGEERVRYYGGDNSARCS